jgi:hypothetical protein
MERPPWSYSVASKDPEINPFIFWSMGMNEKLNLQRKLNTREEFVARIMNCAAIIKQEGQDDVRRATRTIA